MREPRRIALSLLFELFQEEVLNMDVIPIKTFKEKELSVLWTAWQKDINSPLSSSAGRLFDAVASFLDIIHICTYEAQAPMMLEDLYDPSVKDFYHYEIKDRQIDWQPLFNDVIQDKEKTKAPTRFLNTLARIVLDSVELIGIEKVCLSGGVFQNAPLSCMVAELLKDNGFSVYMHKLVPSNDGGLSLGQAYFGGMK